MIAYVIILMAFQNPDSEVVVLGSMIPFTSPIVMLARIPYGVPMWQLIVSIVLLLLTFFGCAWLSAKIYKVGILMFGKKSTFKDLWKWIKINNEEYSYACPVFRCLPRPFGSGEGRLLAD